MNTLKTLLTFLNKCENDKGFIKRDGGSRT